jgi:hypothetical protein
LPSGKQVFAGFAGLVSTSILTVYVNTGCSVKEWKMSGGAGVYAEKYVSIISMVGGERQSL